MNFFPATPTEIGFRLPFGAIALTNRVRTALGRHPRPANIIVGVRPEHFEDAALIDPLERSRSLTFQVTADLVESLGADKYVYFSTAGAEAQSDQLDELAADPRSGSSLGGNRFVARVSADSPVTTGAPVELALDTTKLNVFDADSGLNLTASPV